MSLIKLIRLCMFSPRLYKIYRTGTRLEPNEYTPNKLEAWGDVTIYTMYLACYYGTYLSPFLAYYCYNQGPMILDQLLGVVGLFGPFVAISLFLRSLGRALNQDYVTFARVYSGSSDNKRLYIQSLRRYDFDFEAWPVSYSVGPKLRPGAHCELLRNPFRSVANEHMWFFKRIPIQILGYIAIHTFAMPLIYPGSLGVVKTIFRQRLAEGRAELVENHNGKRAKLSTIDNNILDTMFIDMREDSDKGKILIICTEGNSGFYEVGVMMCPIKAGYSTLGYNHPGFCESTGEAFPPQDQCAIDCVIQYATTELQFDFRDIVLYGWSIGGYASAWAAAKYPDIRCLVLDATFDDILPLANAAMPKSWAPLVREVILTYANLDISAELYKYSGRVNLIRRTDDEVICVERGNRITNRGNYLILKLIAQRHPEFSHPENLKNILQNMVLLPEQLRIKLPLMTEIEKDSLKLVRRYMTDFRASHCEPLKPDILDRIVMK